MTKEGTQELKEDEAWELKEEEVTRLGSELEQVVERTTTLKQEEVAPGSTMVTQDQQLDISVELHANEHTNEDPPQELTYPQSEDILTILEEEWGYHSEVFSTI